MKVFFSILLFLNLTGTYRFAAGILGCEVSIVSSAILSGLLLWFALNFKHVRRLLNNSFFMIALFLVLLWPTVTALYAPEISFNRIALQLYYFLLFTNTIIFMSKYGYVSLSKIIFFSYWIAIAGIFLSFLKPEYFSSVASITRATTDYYGRAFGFMLQPNMAVTNLTVLFILYSGFRLLRNKILQSIVILSYVFSILLTGSRSGIVAMLIVLALLLFRFCRKHVRKKDGKIVLKRNLYFKLPIYFIITVFAISFTVTTLRYIETHNLIKSEKAGFGFRERLENFVQGKLSSTSLSEDINVKARIEFQKIYISKIVERPFWGFGIGSKEAMFKTGEILRPSHNQFLNYSLEYGILYSAVFFIFILILPIFMRKRVLIESFFQTDWILQICLLILILSLVSNTVLLYRGVWVALGAIFYYLYFEKLKVVKKICLPCTLGQ